MRDDTYTYSAKVLRKIILTHIIESIHVLQNEREIGHRITGKAAGNLLLHHDALRLRYERLPNGVWKQWNEGIEEQMMLTVISLDEVPEADWHQVIQKRLMLHKKV